MAANELIKQPAEKIYFGIDFVNKLSANDALSAVTSVASSPDGLAITGTAISGTQVAFFCASGTDGVSYRIEALVTTAAAEILEGDAILRVSDV